MPVSTILDGGSAYCRWHRACLNAPRHAHDQGAFEQWLESHQRAYPAGGWWGWPPEQLWPVLQGVATVWATSEAA